MAGLTTSAYRRHLKAHGAGLVTTEMVSAYGLVHGNVRTGRVPRLRRGGAAHRPCSSSATRPRSWPGRPSWSLSREPRPDLLDINMGCPGAQGGEDRRRRGAAGATRTGRPRWPRPWWRWPRSLGVPVTVKLRSGLDEDRHRRGGAVRGLEEAGVAALAVHPRAAAQYYRGKADHRVTAAVVAGGRHPGDGLGRRHLAGGCPPRLGRDRGGGGDGGPRGGGQPLAGGRAARGRRRRPRPPLAVVVADLRALLAAASVRGHGAAARWMRKLWAGTCGRRGCRRLSIERPRRRCARRRALAALGAGCRTPRPGGRSPARPQGSAGSDAC